MPPTIAVSQSASNALPLNAVATTSDIQTVVQTRPVPFIGIGTYPAILPRGFGWCQDLRVLWFGTKTPPNLPISL